MAREQVFLAVHSLSAGNGGICRVARLMAKALAEKQRFGARVHGIVLSDQSPPSQAAFPVDMAHCSRWRFSLGTCAAALSHSHFIYDFLGMARAHCRLPGLRRPSLCYIHGVEVWEGAATNRIRTARKIDFLLSNSAYTRRRAERVHGGFARAKVCWLATESDELPAGRHLPMVAGAGPPTVLILARLDKERYKGHDELIACWPEVVSAVSDARLLIVGSGRRLEEIKKKAAALPAAPRIEFRGFVDDAEMESVWGETTVFAMPSRGEGFGLVYIEAMRHAIPVIASIHDAAPEVNLEGQTGYNVNLDRPEELPGRIIDLLKNHDLALRLGLNGQERWAEHFRYSAFRDRFLPLLDEFLEAAG